MAGKEKFIVDELKHYDQISEAYGIWGVYDAIAVLSGSNLQEIDSFITEKIRTIPYVNVTSTLIACESEYCASD